MAAAAAASACVSGPGSASASGSGSGSGPVPASGPGSGPRWCFSRQQLRDSPSRRGGVDWDRELSYRQQAANLVQDMGQRLSVSQLTINTAIVYMHRFYMQQCFTKFHRNTIAPAALFLAAKVEEQPRKLEHVIKVAHACLNPQEPPPDVKSELYLQEAQDLVILESVILQTLGFEITIDHPHTHVVKCTQLVRASKDLAQTSYFMATNSLHLTTFCLQYRPPVVACVCIHLACKWSNWEIPVSNDGKNWWEYVDPSVTRQLLDELTHEFLQILEKTPNRLKRIKNWRACQASKKPRLDGVDLEEGPGLGSGGLPPPSLLSTAPHPRGDGLAEEGEGEGEGERGAGGRKGVPLRVTLSQYRVKRGGEGLAWQRPPRTGGERGEKRRRSMEEGGGEEGGGGRKGEKRKEGGGSHRHKHHRYHCTKRGEGEGRRKVPLPLPLPLLLPPPSPLPVAPPYPETNGHSHYKDAFEMLESLLSAQGVPRGGGGGGGGGRRGRQPPPLPAEPPPPLPPLPE